MQACQKGVGGGLEEDGAQTVVQGHTIQNFAWGNAFIAKVSVIEPLNA